MYSRNQVIDDLKTFLFSQKDIIAVFEGGSAATGFVDEVSDLDISIVCEDEMVEQVFQQVGDHLNQVYGILHQFRIPEPAWHGLSQTFYQIKHVPPLFYLDVAVIKRSIKDKLMEKDRHGTAPIWFQKEPMYDNTPSSPDVILQRGKKFYLLATQVDFLSIIEVKKAIARNQWIQAFSSYYGFIARNFAILLNLTYRPEKVDFGLRYAHRDYPQDQVRFIEEALKVSTIEQLDKMFSQLLTRYEMLKNELAEKWGPKE